MSYKMKNKEATVAAFTVWTVAAVMAVSVVTATPLIRNSFNVAWNSMTSSERPSPEPPSGERSVPSHTEREGILEMLWRLQMP